jgi:1-acyl-sn-glycerol-3-phosphate acyltransferase
MGPTIQHRRLVHAAAPGTDGSPLCPPFLGSIMSNPHTGSLIRIGRGLRLLGKLSEAIVLVWLVLPRIGASRHDGIIERWCREVLHILDIRVIVQGQRPSGRVRSVLFVANHISWMDILLLNACQRVRFIAKEEVRSWPLIGWIAARTGTVFLKRTSTHQLARVMKSTAASLRRGDCIAIFPEGTTTDGSAVHAFHSGLFESAIEAKAMIWPIGISRRRLADSCQKAVEQSLVAHPKLAAPCRMQTRAHPDESFSLMTSA